jgi:hypothetical protein
MDPEALVARLGLPLLSFCLAAEPDDVQAWISGEGDQPHGATLVLDQCAALLDSPIPGFAGVRDAFCRVDAASGRSPALELHIAAGGHMPTVDAEDRVAVALSELAAGSFPTLLLAEPARMVRDAAMKQVASFLSSVDPNLQVAPHPQMPDTPQIEGTLFPLVLQHPRFDTLLRAIEADPPFAKVLAAKPTNGVKTFVWAPSRGQGQTVALPSMPWMLLVDGYRRVRALGRRVQLAVFVSEVLAAWNWRGSRPRRAVVTCPPSWCFAGDTLRMETVSPPYSASFARSTRCNASSRPRVAAGNLRSRPP